jgi:DNA-binding MarR family transcriptional regulator
MAIDQTRQRFTQGTPPDGADARLFLREEELDRAADLILEAARVFFSAAQGPLKDLKLGAAHYRALAAIRRGPAGSVSVLLSQLKVRKQSLARVLNDLERAGLIMRERSTKDGRARAVVLTPAGEAAERATSAALRERLAEVFRVSGAEAVAGARLVLSALAKDSEDGA